MRTMLRQVWGTPLFAYFVAAFLLFLGYAGVVLQTFPQGARGASFDPLVGRSAVLCGLICIALALRVLIIARRMHSQERTDSGRGSAPLASDRMTTVRSRVSQRVHTVAFDVSHRKARSGSVAITVRDTRGVVENAHVVLQVPLGERQVFKVDGFTGADGTCVFRFVPPGHGQILVRRSEEMVVDVEVADEGLSALEVSIPERIGGT